MLRTGPASDPAREAETNRQTFDRPVAEVNSALLAVAEREGRKIVLQDADALSLRVSYPFSWRANTWGGVITITCTAGDAPQSKPATTVRVIGGARDALFRVRKLGDSILHDLRVELERISRSDAAKSTDPLVQAASLRANAVPECTKAESAA